MKSLLIVFLIIPVMAFAQTPKKLIKAGEYDQAIDLLIQSLEKNSKNRKNISLLEEAFLKVNKQDNDSIISYKMSGMPEIWGKVYNLYFRLDLRQLRVRNLPANVVQSIDYDWKDYTMDLETARSKAAAFYYAHAIRLLDKSGRENARRAYRELWLITRLYDTYKDTDKLMRHALIKDCGSLPVKVINRTGSELPPSLPENVVKIRISPIEKAYLDYTLKPISGWKYEYTISIFIDRVLITPDQTDKSKESYTKEVQVKSEFFDSVTETVSCDIFEVKQHKAAEIICTLCFIDNYTGKAVYKTPVRAKTVFNHTSYYVKGDLRACPDELKKKVNSGDKPFPVEESMVEKATLKLADMIKDIIWDKDYVYK